MVVVLPAPSGPIRPNISPRSTDSESASTAVVEPYRFVTRSSTMAAMGPDSPLQWNVGFDRHARFQHAAAVVDGNLHAIHELGALVGGLYVPRRELGLLRDVAHGPWNAGTAGVGRQRRGLAEAQPRHDGFVEVDVGPCMIQVGDDDDRRARRNQLADVGE